jgi:hypothetical protein
MAKTSDLQEPERGHREMESRQRKLLNAGPALVRRLVASGLGAFIGGTSLGFPRLEGVVIGIVFGGPVILRVFEEAGSVLRRLKSNPHFSHSKARGRHRRGPNQKIEQLDGELARRQAELGATFDTLSDTEMLRTMVGLRGRLDRLELSVTELQKGRYNQRIVPEAERISLLRDAISLVETLESDFGRTVSRAGDPSGLSPQTQEQVNGVEAALERVKFELRIGASDRISPPARKTNVVISALRQPGKTLTSLGSGAVKKLRRRLR